MVDNSSKLKTEIERLKREKNAVILAHYYTLPEVQEVADFLGDSLALSIEAQKTDARIILFAGVHFMAETAKVLSPEKKVLLPNLEAGCSLAESCDAAAFAAFKAKYPGYKVVSYVNTSVGVKALTDVCCTSSNALKVVESIPADQPIIFAPDRNLGSYIQKLTGRENMVIWDGACHVHEEFSLEKILELKRQHPAAQVVVHPECRAYIVQVADFVGSTAAILDYCGKSSAREFIVVTEAGILTEMKRRYPGLPYLMLGHSMGSFYARQYLCEYGQELSGAIIMGTGHQPKALVQFARSTCRALAAVHGWQYRSKLVANLSFMGYNKGLEGRTTHDWLNRDAAEVDKYLADERCTFTFTLNAYYSMFSGILRLHDPAFLARMPKDLPLLFLAGTADPVGDRGKGVLRAIQSLKAAGVQNIRCKLYPGARHELLVETNRQEVFADIAAWLNDQLR